MRRAFAFLFLLILIPGCEDPPADNLENEVPNKQAEANALLVQALDALRTAQGETGTTALSYYENSVLQIHRITSDYSETDLVVHLLSGEPILFGKSLQEIEARISKLKRLPQQVMGKLDRSTDGQFDLTGSSVTDDALEHLQDVPVVHLRLDNSRITNVGLAYIQNMAEIETLILKETQITDADLEFLKQLPNLKSLSLWGTQVTDAGLSNLTGMRQLEYLSIQDTRVTDTGLAKLESLSGLKVLWLAGTKVTSKGVASLENELSLCDTRPNSDSLGNDEPTAEPEGPDLSSPEKALALYFGSRTWGERLTYTLFGIPPSVFDSTETDMKNAYRTASDKVLWPTGALYKIEKMSNTKGMEGEIIGVDVKINLKDAERFVKHVYGNGKDIDIADSSITCSYFLELRKRDTTGRSEYRIDWAKTYAGNKTKLRDLEKYVGVVNDALKKAEIERKEQLTIARWRLENAALSVRVLDIKIDRKFTYVYWKVTNNSRANIAGVTIGINIDGDTPLDELRIDNLDAGESITDIKKYANIQGGSSFREQGWKAKIQSLRIESTNDTLYAESYFELR